MSARILIINNETLFMTVLGDSLVSSFTDAHVELAASPGEALERMRATDYDVVLSDVAMPGMKGIDLVREASHLKPTPAFVLLTDDCTQFHQAYESGAYACVDKPFGWDLLTTVLKRAVEFHNLERREERFKQLLAFQARPATAYTATGPSSTVPLEKGAAEIRKNELDALIQTTLSARLNQKSSSFLSRYRELHGQLGRAEVQRSDVPDVPLVSQG